MTPSRHILSSKPNLFFRAFLYALLLTIFSAAPSFATELSSEQKGAISQNCNSIKTSLSALQKSDSKTRVLLGASYQTVLTNFLTPLNIRLIKANLSDATLSTTQANIASEWTAFQDQFTKYSQSLEALINTDCKSHPEVFYEKLEATRSARKSLNKTSIKINNLIFASVSSVSSLRDSVSQNPKKEPQNDSQ